MKARAGKPGNTAQGLIWMIALEKLVLEMRNVIGIKIRGTLIENPVWLVLIGRPFIWSYPFLPQVSLHVSLPFYGFKKHTNKYATTRNNTEAHREGREFV